LILAAAVSDFYVNESEIPEHKIQSGARDELVLRLRSVPKCLGRIRELWAPQAFVVSFKLETDSAILLQKAAAALHKYGVHIVVANELHSRYRQILLVSRSVSGSDESTSSSPPNRPAEQLITKPADGTRLEHALVHHLLDAHAKYVAKELTR